MSVISYLLKIIFKYQIIYRHLYTYADDDTLLVPAFKLILLYFQQNFYSLLTETDSTFDHLLN